MLNHNGSSFPLGNARTKWKMIFSELFFHLKCQKNERHALFWDTGSKWKMLYIPFGTAGTIWKMFAFLGIPEQYEGLMFGNV